MSDSLTSACGFLSSQIKDILKGALRFNQSQLETEENEEITIADDHYTTAAAESALSINSHHSDHHSDHQQHGGSRQSRDSDLDGSGSMDEKEEDEQPMTPLEQQVNSRLVLF